MKYFWSASLWGSLFLLVSWNALWAGSCSGDPPPPPGDCYAQTSIRLNGAEDYFLGLNQSDSDTCEKNIDNHAADDAFSSNRFVIQKTNLRRTVLNSAPVLSSIGNQSHTAFTAVSLDVVATHTDGDTLTFSALGLPTGITINGSTGTMTGTPTAVGDYTTTVTVSNGIDTDSETFTWHITNTAPVLSGIAEQVAEINVPASLTLSAADLNGDTLTYSASGLPMGLSIDSETGVITGTPNTLGNFTTSITISDGTDTDTEHFIWRISGPLLSSSSPALGATDVSLKSNLVLNFSSAVLPGSGYVTIKKTNDDSVFERIAVRSSQVRGHGTTQITINPKEWFVAGTSYYVLIDSTAFQSSSGAPYLGISSSSTLSFTTSTGSPSPREEAEVMHSIQKAPAVAKRMADKVMRPVAGRLNYLRSAPRQSTHNVSRQGVRMRFKNPVLHAAAAALHVFDSFKFPDQLLGHGMALWTSGEISVGKDPNNNVTGAGASLFQTDSLSVGMDKRWTPDLSMGLSLQFSNESLNNRNNASNHETHSYSATAYGHYRWHEHAYMQMAWGASTLQTDHKRVHDSGTLLGNRTGRQMYMNAVAAWEWTDPFVVWAPYGHVNSSITFLDDYQEFGSNAALFYHNQHIGEASYGLGVRIHANQLIWYNTWHPRMALIWQSDVHSHTKARTHYVASPASIHTSRYDVNPKTTWQVAVGGDLVLVKGWSVSMDAEHQHQERKGYNNNLRFQLQKVKSS